MNNYISQIIQLSFNTTVKSLARTKLPYYYFVFFC